MSIHRRFDTDPIEGFDDLPTEWVDEWVKRWSDDPANYTDLGYAEVFRYLEDGLIHYWLQESMLDDWDEEQVEEDE